MFGRFVHFFSYHNAVPLAAMFIFLSSGVALAQSEVVQEQVISEETIVRSIDNGYIIEMDLEDFDPRLRIVSVTEDEDFFFVEYEYQTIDIDDYVWKDVEVTSTLSVSKEGLGSRDLGLYVAEQLGEEIEAKMAYLKDVQKVETQKGLSRKVATTEYKGLVGKYLDSEEIVFDGYKPLKDEPRPVVASVDEAVVSAAISENNQMSAAVAKALPSKAELQAIIQGQVSQLLAGKVAAQPTATTTDTGTDDDDTDVDADDDDDDSGGSTGGTGTTTATTTDSGVGDDDDTDTATSTDTGTGNDDTSTTTDSGTGDADETSTDTGTGDDTTTDTEPVVEDEPTDETPEAEPEPEPEPEAEEPAPAE